MYKYTHRHTPTTTAEYISEWQAKRDNKYYTHAHTHIHTYYLIETEQIQTYRKIKAPNVCIPKTTKNHEEILYLEWFVLNPLVVLFAPAPLPHLLIYYYYYFPSFYCYRFFRRSNAQTWKDSDRVQEHLVFPVQPSCYCAWASVMGTVLFLSSLGQKVAVLLSW